MSAEDEWGHHEEVSEDPEEGDQPHSPQDLRQLANAHFQNHDFDSALPLYTMALETLVQEQSGRGFTDENDLMESRKLHVIFLCNRAACLFRMELYEEAKNDALQAVHVSEGKSAKASFRLAKTHLALLEYLQAIQVTEDALQQLKSSHGGEEEEAILLQRKELVKLLEKARVLHLNHQKIPNAETLATVHSIKEEPRKPSFREFDVIKQLGEGNFSRVVAVRHSITHEEFALKIIEKKKAESLVKRQHPNVYNEIAMERRILSERLVVNDDDPMSKRIIKLYHSFQDYNSLYFLVELHLEGGDMWSKLRHKGKMVGLHHSLARRYLFELVEALEFIHSRGVVHRDLKAENILLSPTGHLVLIDFGTAKDLIHTDLNGPEFVGTPEFMAPESVRGTSDPEAVAEERKKGVGSDHTLDLWALGAVAYQFLTGVTPFWSPSQYHAFLKIQRCNLCRPIGITDDNAWEFIVKLMKIDPKARLGAGCYEYVRGKEGVPHQIIEKGSGYYSIRKLPYFSSYLVGEASDEIIPIPSLKDLCIRACADLVENDSLNLNIDKEHPPGCGSSHDMLRLNKSDRGRVMDLLDRLRSLSRPRIYRRFFKSKQDARLSKVRVATRDYVGLTMMNDKQYQFPTADAQGGNVDTERSDVLAPIFPIRFMHVTNPLFVKELNAELSDEKRIEYIVQLKDSLRKVNKTRPKLIVASGYLDPECRKLLGKVNESINVILNDGSSFFSFWSYGGQGIVLRGKDFLQDGNALMREEQMKWLRQELEQSQMTRHHAYVFVDTDPRNLPPHLIRSLAKGRILCLFGVADGPPFESEYEYGALKEGEPGKSGIKTRLTDKEMGYNDDNISVSSDESEGGMEEDRRVMKILARSESSLRCMNLKEYGEWNFETV